MSTVYELNRFYSLGVNGALYFPQVILLAVVAFVFHLSLAAPGDLSSEEEVILKDERAQDEDGRFNFEIETSNGIRLSQGGSPDGVDGAVNHAGEYS